jgi:hypothetical protein
MTLYSAAIAITTVLLASKLASTKLQLLLLLLLQRTAIAQVQTRCVGAVFMHIALEIC